MTDTERISRLEIQMENLQNAYLQSQKNLVPTTSKVDNTANNVVKLTPYTEIKTAYIEDTVCVFNNVPQGYPSIAFDNYDKAYSVQRNANRIIVQFESLDKITNIKLTIN